MKETILKTFHQEGKFKKSNTTLYGSILLIVSAILPCLDVLLKFFFPIFKDLRDSSGVLVTVDIWLATLYVSPAIIILATNMNPHPKFYFFPLFIFSYTGYVYFSPIIGTKVDFLQYNSWAAVIGSVISTLLYMGLLRYVKRIRLYEEGESNLQEDFEYELKKLKSENQKLLHQIKSHEIKEYE